MPQAAAAAIRWVGGGGCAAACDGVRLQTFWGNLLNVSGPNPSQFKKPQKSYARDWLSVKCVSAHPLPFTAPHSGMAPYSDMLC